MHRGDTAIVDGLYFHHVLRHHESLLKTYPNCSQFRNLQHRISDISGCLLRRNLQMPIGDKDGTLCCSPPVLNRATFPLASWDALRAMSSTEGLMKVGDPTSHCFSQGVHQQVSC